MVKGLVSKPYQLEQRPRWLVAHMDQPWNVVSWAVVNGGFRQTNQIAWLFLKRDEIAGIDDPAQWMCAEMHRAGLASAVGFMTSRREHAWFESGAIEGECRCHAVGTAGFSNALRVGDPAVGPSSPGTVNLVAFCSRPVTPEAAIESIGLIAEAKTLATLTAGIPSVVSGKPSTGTGTDYLAIAWPTSGQRIRYAGKHTDLGAAVGRAAYLAVTRGIDDWRGEGKHPS